MYAGTVADADGVNGSCMLVLIRFLHVWKVSGTFAAGGAIWLLLYVLVILKRKTKEKW